MEENNNTNKMPIYKLGQILTWKEEANHKGFKTIVEVSGVIISILIKKDHLHLKYQSPDIIYELRSEKDPGYFWKKEQSHLKSCNPSIKQGYAIDDKVLV